jgi:hypothetical protein
MNYDILRPLGELECGKLSRLTSVYGVMGIKMRPDGNAMTVEYDATRLNPDGVDRVLMGAGLPVKRGE